MNELNNGLPGKFSDNPGQINRLVKLQKPGEPIKPVNAEPSATLSDDMTTITLNVPASEQD